MWAKNLNVPFGNLYILSMVRLKRENSVEFVSIKRGDCNRVIISECKSIIIMAMDHCVGETILLLSQN